MSLAAIADGFARDLAAVVADDRAHSHICLRAIAIVLTARGIKTRRHRAWHVSTEQQLMGRMDELCLLEKVGNHGSKGSADGRRSSMSDGRPEFVKYQNVPALLALLLIVGCTGVEGDRAVVDGAGPDELLKLRAGPSLGYKVILGLPDGTEVIRNDCVTELGQRWCRVTIAAARGVSGYVSADYLAAP